MSTTDFRVVIPVRLESKRLPTKALADIVGKPMIQHVYERALESGAESVIIATDSEEIKKVAEDFGAQVVMTLPEHSSGTERIAEAAMALGYDDDDIIVNVQGDEPLIPPTIIHQVANNLESHETVKVATLCQPIDNSDDLFNADVVKVVRTKRNFAMYFSRGPIPWEREHFPCTDLRTLGEHHHRHIGIYAYRVKFLQEYADMEVSPLEEMEHLEQLRVLWNGVRIHADSAKEKVPHDVNTEEDLKQVREFLKKK